MAVNKAFVVKNGALTSSVGTLGSNGNGTRTVQSGGSPTGGADGDIYYIY